MFYISDATILDFVITITITETVIVRLRLLTH